MCFQRSPLQMSASELVAHRIPHSDGSDSFSLVALYALDHKPSMVYLFIRKIWVR